MFPVIQLGETLNCRKGSIVTRDNVVLFCAWFALVLVWLLFPFLIPLRKFMRGTTNYILVHILYSRNVIISFLKFITV